LWCCFRFWYIHIGGAKNHFNPLVKNKSILVLIFVTA
jgi:hypothetical protein